jgi:hypothetical protein
MRSFFEGIADEPRTAQGKPFSHERQRQIKSLYPRRIESLTTYLNAADQRVWTDFLVGQPEGCPLVACVEALEQRQSMPLAKANLLRLYGCEDLNQFSSRRTALFSICADFSARQVEWIKREKRRGPEKFSTAIDHQQYRGVRLYVSLSGTLTVCGEIQGIQRQARIKHKAIAVKTWLDKRTIDVKADYINVLDENGDSLHTVSRALCKSKDLYALWDFMLGFDHATVSTGIVVPQYPDSSTTESSTEADGVSSGTDVSQVKKLGKPPLRQNQLGSRTQNSPPEMIDALWLLNEFVNERFPSGGLFWTGDPALFPKSTADLQAFRKYDIMMIERTLLTSNRFLK